jgi:serine/threonine protein kinase
MMGFHVGQDSHQRNAGTHPPLHQKVIHSDLKARNCLLKSDGSDGRGLVAKSALWLASAPRVRVWRARPASTPLGGASQGRAAATAPRFAAPRTANRTAAGRRTARLSNVNRPAVADFGLAVRIGDVGTHVSEFQGTQTHMSPEAQLSARISKAGDGAEGPRHSRRALWAAWPAAWLCWPRRGAKGGFR